MLYCYNNKLSDLSKAALHSDFCDTSVY